MAHAILGQDPRQLNHVERAMDLCLPGHLYAKAPVDLACWDIAGQAAGLTIADLLGGRDEEGTWIASSVSSGDPYYMFGIIQSYRQRGYKSHSVKVGGDVDKDIERIRYIEEKRLPDECGGRSGYYC
jgi:L-alanine-DL-glutamate epimerase-like enolase superfamily enzyme